MIALRKRQRGIVLVLVLWMVVVLSLIAYSLLFQVTTESSMTAARKKHLKAEALARAGVARAIVDLRNDIIFDHAEEAKRFDAEGDPWARPEEDKDEFALADEIFAGDERDGYFSVRVYDEDGLFNINRISHSNRQILQTIMEKIGYSEEDAVLAAAAIVDWRDSDMQVGLADSPHTDEGIAYAILKGEDTGGETDPERVEPIVLRNEDFLTLDELLEVYGVTPDLYFGPGTAEAKYYNQQLGIEETRRRDRFHVEEPRRRRGDPPPLGLRDYLTVHGSGILNINTAPAHVLDALAVASGAGDEGFGERVLRLRRGGRENNITNSNAFEDFTEVMANAEVQGVVGVARALYPIGVQSTTFRIVSFGVVEEVRARKEVLVFREMARLNRDEAFEYSDRVSSRLERNRDRFRRRENNQNEEVINHPYVRIVQAIRD
jgi:type II secretory pathway component PulK